MAGFSQCAKTITWPHLSPLECCASSPSKFKNLASKELFSARNWLEVKSHPYIFFHFSIIFRGSMCYFSFFSNPNSSIPFLKLNGSAGIFLTWRVDKIPGYLLLYRAVSLQLAAWRKEKGCLLGPSCSNVGEGQFHYICSCPFFFLLFPLKDFPVSKNPSTSNLPSLIFIFLWETHMYTMSWSIQQLFLWTPWIAFTAWQTVMMGKPTQVGTARV